MKLRFYIKGLRGLQDGLYLARKVVDQKIEGVQAALHKIQDTYLDDKHEGVSNPHIQVVLDYHGDEEAPEWVRKLSEDAGF